MAAAAAAMLSSSTVVQRQLQHRPSYKRDATASTMKALATKQLSMTTCSATTATAAEVQSLQKDYRSESVSFVRACLQLAMSAPTYIERSELKTHNTLRSTIVVRHSAELYKVYIRSSQGGCNIQDSIRAVWH
eukprot:1049-Heterococcus_DN1.PRE.2